MWETSTCSSVLRNAPTTHARGDRPRDEHSRNTARLVLHHARALRPRWVVIENVVHMRSWCGYGDLLRDLEQDYFVRVQVLDAAEFGVPQKRRRLFIVCDREATPHEVLPGPDNGRPDAASILEPQGTYPAKPLFDNGRAEATLERARRGMKALGEGERFLVVYYGSDGCGGWQPLDRPLRTLTTLDRFGLVEWEGNEPTLRMLQVPELRRAMGFDEGYRLLHGSRRDRIKILGNSVCPPVMEAIVGTLIGQRSHSGDQGELRLIAAK